MNIVGIIAEYNPFHNGHKYHIEEAKKLTGADSAIIIMSGNYVQRGTPAIIDKYTRTKMALYEGADIVIELPYTAALSSAKDFAFTAVNMLHKLGCVTHLVFGSECSDISLLDTIADILSSESVAFKTALNNYLRAGLSYPRARYLAVCEEMQDETIENILNMPNNILGIEYLLALKELNSNIIPYTVHRNDNGYSNENLSESGFSSACAIRNDILQGTNSLFKKHMPANAKLFLEEYIKNNSILTANDFSQLLYSKLMQLSYSPDFPYNLTKYQDVNEDIANAISNKLGTYTTFSDFSSALKSKNLTQTRINRLLMHILLEITEEDCSLYRDLSFGKLLGFNSDSSSILRNIQDNDSFKLITKPADATDILTPEELKLYQHSIKNDNAYYYINYIKSISSGKHTFKHNEITRNIIINKNVLD